VLKNQLSLTLALALIVSLLFTPGVFALDYINRLGNKATFETLEETRASSPAAAASQGSGNGRFKSHPVLDGYPKGTAYVYRSANLWGGRANRSNTNILVFAEKSFRDKDVARPEDRGDRILSTWRYLFRETISAGFGIMVGDPGSFNF
jgi:hypothetical protein